ncbi:hypothetical protein GCM10010954_28920 [Halobacillus andaensis]|uniref:Transposase n=1 Tax=Halobacillus andaensis TaxID=1176239 RepID=A0A917EXS9_HALAA|nr:transposase [Halobacillus andaensis]GGF28045.1 hypothetical protein GCM10010954_28920 [Halobacillus andaensis]
MFDPKTIRKYINSNELPKKKSSQKRHSKLDSYKEYLEKRIKEGTTNCEVLLDEIMALGYEGKIRDFVRLYRARPKKQATIRCETTPGKQAQMDWEHIGKFEVDGELKEVY